MATALVAQAPAAARLDFVPAVSEPVPLADPAVPPEVSFESFARAKLCGPGSGWDWYSCWAYLDRPPITRAAEDILSPNGARAPACFLDIDDLHERLVQRGMQRLLALRSSDGPVTEHECEVFEKFCAKGPLDFDWAGLSVAANQLTQGLGELYPETKTANKLSLAIHSRSRLSFTGRAIHSGDATTGLIVTSPRLVHQRELVCLWEPLRAAVSKAEDNGVGLADVQDKRVQSVLAEILDEVLDQGHAGRLIVLITVTGAVPLFILPIPEEDALLWCSTKPSGLSLLSYSASDDVDRLGLPRYAVIVGDECPRDDVLQKLSLPLTLLAATSGSWDDLDCKLLEAIRFKYGHPPSDPAPATSPTFDLPLTLSEWGRMQSWRFITGDELKQNKVVYAAFMTSTGWVDPHTLQRLSRANEETAEDALPDTATETLPLLLLSTKQLGSGNQGAVHFAFAAPPCPLLAVKFAEPGCSALEKVRTEGEALARLTKPGQPLENVAPPFFGNFAVEQRVLGYETHALVMQCWGKEVKVWCNIQAAARTDFLQRVTALHETHHLCNGSLSERNMLVLRDPSTGLDEVRLIDWARIDERHNVGSDGLSTRCGSLQELARKINSANEQDERVRASEAREEAAWQEEKADALKKSDKEEVQEPCGESVEVDVQSDQDGGDAKRQKLSTPPARD